MIGKKKAGESLRSKNLALVAGLLLMQMLGAATPAADELLDDWIAQDAGLGVRQVVTDQNRAALLMRAGAKLGLARRDGEDEAAWIARYRAACVARRKTRLAGAAKLARHWVYARHYVMGGSYCAYTEALSDAAAERSWGPVGGGLYLAEYTPDGFWRETPLLETKTGCFRDVDVSLDGTRVLYAYKANDREDDFHLYELDLATKQTRQLTFGLGVADYEGCYLPDGNILFSSSRCCQIVDCFWTEVSNLYRINAKGGELTRITYDQVHDVYPTLSDDGMVLYMRWDYNDRSQMFPQILFGMASDGTRQRAVYGENSWYPTTMLHTRRVPGSPYYFTVGTGHHTWQPGELLRIDPRAGRQEESGVWEMEPLRKGKPVRVDAFGQGGRLALYPYPVDESSVVLSFLPEGWGKGRSRMAPFGLYWTDVNGGRELLVSRQGKFPCGRPVPVRARTMPVPASTVDRSKSTGIFSVADVYKGQAMQGVARGCVKSLRVVEIVYRHVGIGHTEHLGPGGLGLCSTPPSLGRGVWDIKKVWGEVPVEADGSVAFEAPAKKPLYFQLLDARGRVVQTMRSWTTLQPGENLGCVGCHESANEAPSTQTAVKDWSKVRYGVLKEPARGFSYPQDVQPILNRRCVGCHDPAKRLGVLDLTAKKVADPLAKRLWYQSYMTLTHGPLQRIWPNKPDSIGARGEPDHVDLNWISAASVPTRIRPGSRGSIASSWFSAHLDRGHCPALTEAELRTLACWVDLGVPFCGTYDEANNWTPQEKARFTAAEAKFNQWNVDRKDNGK